MRQEELLSFVPLHLSALDRHPELLRWLEDLTSQSELEVLTPTDWFSRGQDHYGNLVNSDGLWVPKIRPGLLVWAPPPAAAETALEELRLARMKRHQSTHIFLCPRLLEPKWRSHLHKSADLVLEIPVGTSFWPSNMFEPLILAFYFPYLSHRPWELKGTPSLVELGRRLRPLWKTDQQSAGTILRKFWNKERAFPTMPPNLVFKMLHSFKELHILH